VLEPFIDKESMGPGIHIPLKFDLWLEHHGIPSSMASVVYSPYLEYMETTVSQRRDISAFGFKIIANQMTERRGLLKTLRRNNFEILFLIRKNVIRQAISSMIAEQRGVYNAKGYTPPESESFVLDTSTLAEAAARFERSNEETQQLFEEMGFPVHTFYYEDYCSNRRAFLIRVQRTLQLSQLNPTETRYSIMTPRDLTTIISNLSQVREQLKRHNSEYVEMLDNPEYGHETT